MDVRPLRFEDGALLILDQTRLPHEERWLRCTRAEDVAEAIRSLAVRGAPAIGLAAAYGLALEAAARDESTVKSRVEAGAELLAATRPTAVNLRWAIEHALAELDSAPSAGTLLAFAHRLAAAQLEQDHRIGEYGAELVPEDARVLTHCNTGPLATGGEGTAGAVIAAAHRSGRLAHVWVDETRPLLQGARLTAWELGRAGIPFEVVPDASAGALMARGLVDAVIVGLGWTGGILAKELTEAGLQVVALERGYRRPPATGRGVAVSIVVTRSRLRDVLGLRP